MPDHTNNQTAIRVSLVRRAAVGAAVLAMGAGAVIAQDAPLRPPTPNELKGAPFILTLLITVVLVGLLVLAAFFPSKRGHQD